MNEGEERIMVSVEDDMVGCGEICKLEGTRKNLATIINAMEGASIHGNYDGGLASLARNLMA